MQGGAQGEINTLSQQAQYSSRKIKLPRCTIPHCLNEACWTNLTICIHGRAILLRLRLCWVEDAAHGVAETQWELRLRKGLLGRAGLVWWDILIVLSSSIVSLSHVTRLDRPVCEGALGPQMRSRFIVGNMTMNLMLCWNPRACIL